MVHESSLTSQSSDQSDCWTWSCDWVTKFSLLIPASRSRSQVVYFLSGFTSALVVAGCVQLVRRYRYPNPERVFSYVLPMLRANRCVSVCLSVCLCVCTVCVCVSVTERVYVSMLYRQHQFYCCMICEGRKQNNA